MSSVSGSTVTGSSSSPSDLQPDHVIPSQDQIDQISRSSKQQWQNLSDRATSMKLCPETVMLSDLLHGLPALPDNLQGLDSVAGQATWELKSTGCAKSSSTRTEREQKWSLTTRRPTLCMISDESPFAYVDSKSHGVSLLFFGWAYILSMGLLERQHIRMEYLMRVPEVFGSGQQPDEQCFTVDIGHVSEDEALWWKILLSPGQKWRAAGTRQPVWAIAYAGNIKIQVVAQVTTASTSKHPQPPSSIQAAEFLSRFASKYNLESQSSLALAMALTLPLHNAMADTVKLPKPSLVREDTLLTSPSSIEREFNNLSRYMTLSSCPRFLSSTLWAIFWEPGVDCNLVSPWCEPIIEIVQPLIKSGHLERLSHTLALRRPHVAPLWYGIAACGDTKTIKAIIPFLQTLHAPILSRPIPEVAVWTGSPQSFMDLNGIGSYVQEDDQVLRADVWRLRHECWEDEPEGIPFQNPPMCPWPPFGSMSIKELEISVGLHVNCERHLWAYIKWTWLLNDGTKEEASAQQNLWLEFENVSHSSLSGALSQKEYSLKNQDASKNAVCDIFRWAATEMDYGGKDIFTHRWVQALVDLEMGEDNSSSGQDSSVGYSPAQVKEWVMKCEAEFAFSEKELP